MDIKLDMENSLDKKFHIKKNLYVVDPVSAQSADLCDPRHDGAGPWPRIQHCPPIGSDKKKYG